jgi:hypothetical protein
LTRRLCGPGHNSQPVFIGEVEVQGGQSGGPLGDRTLPLPHRKREMRAPAPDVFNPDSEIPFRFVGLI